jgi:hypothetical protein
MYRHPTTCGSDRIRMIADAWIRRGMITSYPSGAFGSRRHPPLRWSRLRARAGSRCSARIMTPAASAAT